MSIVSTILARVACCVCGSSATDGISKWNLGERRTQTRRNIVVRFDGNALTLLQGVDGFEDGEALADGNNTQIL